MSGCKIGTCAGYRCLKIKTDYHTIEIIKWSDGQLSISTEDDNTMTVVPFKEILQMPISLTDEDWKKNAQQE